MALARIKTWNAGDVLTASDLMAEFGNILNNATSLISPLTASLDGGGFNITNVAVLTTTGVITAGTTIKAGTSVVQITNATGYVDAAKVPMRGHLWGLGLSNAADTDHDITIAAGEAASSDVLAADRRLLVTSALTKQIDAAWAAGTGAGGMFTGAVGNATWYYLFLIHKTADETIDAGFDTSLTAANIPAGYSKYRRIGSVLTDGAANIIQFVHNGNTFMRKVPIQSYTAVNPGTNAVTVTTQAMPSSIAVMDFIVTDAGGVTIFCAISDLATTDTAASNANAQVTTFSATGDHGSSEVHMQTDIAGRVRMRLSLSGGTTVPYINTRGWIDFLGKLS